MQWNSTPSALDDVFSQSMQQCQGQRHRPLGTVFAVNPTQSRWYLGRINVMEMRL